MRTKKITPKDVTSFVLWITLAPLAAALNMNVYGLEANERAASLLGVQLLLNGIWSISMGSGDKRDRLLRMVLWNASYTVIAISCSYVFSGVKLSAVHFLAVLLIGGGIFLLTRPAGSRAQA